MAERLPSLSRRALRHLRELTERVAVSGDEGPVRQWLRRMLRAAGLPFQTDALGNLIVHRPPSQPDPRRTVRVLVAAHMDEVGLLLTQRTGDGLFRVKPIGGLSPQVALGQTVWVGPQHQIGVIGTTPVHLLAGPASLPRWDDVRLDVSPAGRDVQPGQRATFATRFRLEGDTIFAKALDDRVGVATLLELVLAPPPGVDLWAVFTVQEEVGLRGARVAAYALRPQVALALDCTPARDLPGPTGQLPSAFNTRLGHGPALYVADRRTISDPRLVRHFQTVAEHWNIPYQIRQAGGGSTDAGAMHVQAGGIPSLSLSVPARGLHTPVATLRRRDWQATFRLLWAALDALTPSLLERSA